MTRPPLVAAIRRATRLAVAMDGRGFAYSGSPCRTLARPRAIVARDSFLIVAAFTVPVLAEAPIAPGPTACSQRPPVAFLGCHTT
jgi:energy-coupling factor transporter transmembrane protein EcfT